ncbi:flagellar basal body rod protein FlgB [Clostridium uliginosum]|uniref:Flagellar basal body rod protein FlgB n=1 Tax=Clostridium uliginosum TaxID=119641 RepID=A0A1I1KL57_9CLOT|nr:flagellar basal body rod protein FlgB [Clostridium uliginosum]SFC61002.1 flagellar basal-body rod protein FlgB [Clostridium uliginosum]
MIIQSVNSNNTYDLLKDGIKASDLRGQAIANNIANINTKGYKKFNVVFEENLKAGSDATKFSLKTTNDKHLKDDEKIGNNISIEKENSTSMRSDENNVNLDLEKVNQAANTLKYNALITQINNQFNNLKTVMK